MGYQGFPYISYIDSNIQKELNKRISIDNRLRNITPWVKVTSGVYKKDTNELYSISSFITKQQNSTSNYDFNDIYKRQNRIESGIESVDIKYLSKYGGIRSADIKLKMNSLEQFNEYAPYFLSPGRTILLEWGWSTGAQYILTKDEYESIRFNNINSAWKILNDRSIKSGGAYDAMLGIITDYNFSLDEDSNFDVTISITSNGSLMYGLNLVHQSNVVNSEENKNKYQKTIKDFIRDDLNTVVSNWPYVSLTLLKAIGTKKFDPDVDVYIDKKGKAENNKFVTWGFIEDVIVNPWIGVSFKNSDNSKNQPVFKLKSIDYSDFYVNTTRTNGEAAALDIKFRSSKISNNKYLRSTNLSVCFINNDVDNNTLNFSRPADNKDDSIETDTGYIRNIYVNLDVVREAFESADTLTDALLNILNKINSACVQYWDFNLKINETDQTMRVIDSNYTDVLLRKLIDSDKNKEENLTKDIYLFRAFGGNGIIKSVDFSSKLPNDIKITSLYSNNKEENDDYVINSDSDSFTSIWNNQTQYKDYFYGELKYSTVNKDENLNPTKKEDTSTNINLITNNSENIEFSDALKRYLPSLISMGVSFYTDEVTLMKQLIYRRTEKENQKSNIIIPVDFEMTLEGISGIRIGDIFWIDCVPDIYLENSVFQVTSIDHSIDNDAWYTTIKAILKVNNFNVSAKSIRSSTNRPGIYKNKIKQIKQIISSNVNKSVLKWIKDNMGPILSNNQDSMFTEDILAGIIYVETRGYIYKYGIENKMNAAEVCSLIKNEDAGSTAYSFYQFNYSRIPKEFQQWIDRDGWKRPQEATAKAVKLLNIKHSTLKRNFPNLTREELLKLSIASYNSGEGNAIRKLSSGASIDDINPTYVSNVLNAAEEYKKLT